jgi:Ca-activated chloride channel family protein
MDQRTVTEDSLVNYKYYFQWFALAALVLLILEMLLSERVKLRVNKVPALNRTPLLLIACCFLPIALSAQTENALIKKGNEAYQKKEYDKAIDNYKKVTAKNPANPTAQFNLGNAMYKSQKPDDAVSAYDNALANAGSKNDKSVSYYNKGVVLQNNKKLPECIDAYKNALKLNPEDEDARQNLQKALQQQKQQQQKEKKDKEQKKHKEDEKQKEKEKPKDEDKNNQPKPQPSKLSKQDAEEKLKALLEQEKNLQDKLRRVNTGTLAKPEKDW